MDVYTIIGVVGSTVVLTAFLLNQVNKLKNSSPIYDLMNTISSICLFVYAASTNSVPFMVVNAVWGIFSFKDVLFYLLKTKK
ncbi:hypothetical protein DOJK_00689 [Patescibacteria group bacterium]|jgi:uncharacterized protein with PQ loop repeat|nr:hypothetical protein DOJK_00689 [Patescibacteria group bacterium]